MKKAKKIEIIVSAVIFALAALILINVIIARINKEIPRIFGYSIHIVVTESMSPEIEAGTLVLAKKVDETTIELGNYIVFFSPDPTLKGMPIIHQVIAINEDGTFTTQGTNPSAPVDRYPVSKVEGIYVAQSVVLGKIFGFFTKLENCIFAILIGVLLYITVKLTIRTVKILKTEPAVETVSQEDKDKEQAKLLEEIKIQLAKEFEAKEQEKNKKD